ncbi:MAG TPA: hypothetical protein PK870_10715, partial [Clostridia bacterium]|nr:hypothetical protein [Clostridia bacterium]
MIKINKSHCTYQIQPLTHPFGFKGAYSSCIWTVEVKLESHETKASGSSIQGVLWSDGSLYSSIKEQKANEYMFNITSYVCEQLKGMHFTHPEDLFDNIFQLAMDYAHSVLRIFPRKT